MADRLYFRQLLAGQDFATDDDFAVQMVNFVYLIGDRETGEAVVVDPAYDPAAVVDIAAADGMAISGVLVTHHHQDHIGGEIFGNAIEGVTDLLEQVQVPVHCQADEADSVTKVTGITDELVTHRSGDTVAVGDIEIELIHTPGHTPGSQCFLVRDRLVSGDTLFLDGCGRTDLPGGDTEALMESIATRLARVPDEAVLFPGHRYSLASSATMGITREHNWAIRQAEELIARRSGTEGD